MFLQNQKKTDYIIFPDNTFSCLQIKQKYSGKCYDFDNVKKITKKKCNRYYFSNKINKIYFKGTDTTKNNTNIRKNLEEKSKKNNWLNVNLNAWQNYIEPYKFCEYKGLLNLPGHYPWSNRFKYLFLMKSLVVNIDVYTINLNPKYMDYPYVSFINYIVKKNKHYINLNMIYYRTSYATSKKYEKYIMEKKKNESDKIINKLTEIYHNIDCDKYKKIINDGYKKVRKLSMENIYEYISECISENSKIIND